MLSRLHYIFTSAFKPNPALMLPINFHTKATFTAISKMGNLATPFVARINALTEKYPILLTDDTLRLFITAGPNFESIINAFELIYEQRPSFATVKTLTLLVTLDEHAMSYTQQALDSHADLQALFPVPSELKEMRRFGELKLSMNKISHLINVSEKSHQSVLYANQKPQENHKQWASKMAAELSLEHIAEVERLYNITLQNIPKTRYPSAPLISPFSRFFSKNSLSPSDIMNFQREFFSGVAQAFTPGNNDVSISTRQELDAFIEQKIEANACYPAWAEAYRQSIDLIASKVIHLTSMIKPGRQSSYNSSLLKELENASLFPMRRATFLRESAEAQMEVVAQELRRALCPSDILGGRNPYPKHRLATPYQGAERKMQIIPEVPDIYIASEKINFEHGFSMYHFRGKEQFVFTSEAYRSPATGLEQTDKFPMSHIPGLGVSCLFAKFLGDSDAKLGNMGINVDRASNTPYIFTNLDSGRCFSRGPLSTPTFEMSTEVLINPHTETSYARNFFYSRFDNKPFYTYKDNSIRCFKKYLLELSQDPNIQRENFITAFNLAFFPPQAYELFVKQYVTLNNPFMQRDYFDKILFDHLIKEQKALFNIFEKEPAFLEFFLASSNPQDNLFHRYQQLVTQTESFCFYKKHRMKGLHELQENPRLIDECFFKFIIKKYQSSTATVKRQIENAFHSWDPCAVVISRGVDTLAAVERGQQLKELVRDALHLSGHTDSLLLSQNRAADELGAKKQLLSGL